MQSVKNRALRQRNRKATNALEVHECKVCLASVPSTFGQDHHEVPQAAGGAAGPIANLCPSCHHNLHRVADMLMSNRAGLAEDSVAIMYPNVEARERLFALATTVVEFMTLKRDGKIESGEPVHVMIDLPPQVKLAAAMIANDHRGPTGRRLGLSTWISSLVKREVFARFPHLDPSKTRGRTPPV